ncbi:transposase [candidate division KSB1 bacterium]
MQDLFVNIKNTDARTFFSNEEKCLEYLANEKWKDGYTCRKCGHTNFCKGKTHYSRRCTRCKHEESATAHTIFHRCKIHLPDAFEIAYQVCTSPDISTYELSRQLELRQMTCWKFKKKISECIEKKGKLKLVNPEI